LGIAEPVPAIEAEIEREDDGKDREHQEDQQKGRDRQIEGIVAAHAMQGLAGTAKGHGYPPLLPHK
jgi:hypothetical protein